MDFLKKTLAAAMASFLATYAIADTQPTTTVLPTKHNAHHKAQQKTHKLTVKKTVTSKHIATTKPVSKKVAITKPTTKPVSKKVAIAKPMTKPIAKKVAIAKPVAKQVVMVKPVTKKMAAKPIAPTLLHTAVKKPNTLMQPQPKPMQLAQNNTSHTIQNPAQSSSVPNATQAANTTVANNNQPTEQVNTNVEYNSVIPPNAEVIAGDPQKNEFFIVASDDVQKIKKLVSATPGNQVSFAQQKTKAPVVKVILGPDKSTVTSMEVMPTLQPVVQEVNKQQLSQEVGDDVMDIWNSDRVVAHNNTNLSTIATAAMSPLSAKMQPAPIASTNEANAKPVPLPKEAASPTLETVLKSAPKWSDKHSPANGDEIGKEAGGAAKSALQEADQQPAKQVMMMPQSISKHVADSVEDAVPTKETLSSNMSKTAVTRGILTRIVSVNMTGAYDEAKAVKEVNAKKVSVIKPTAKKLVANNPHKVKTTKAIAVKSTHKVVTLKSTHKAVAAKKVTKKTIASKKVVSKKLMAKAKHDTKKHVLEVGVAQDYSEYLKKTQ